MRSLTIDEGKLVSGGDASTVMGTIGGLTGFYSGAIVGATFAAPITTIGAVFAFSSLQGNELKRILGVLTLFLAASTAGGAAVGGAIGASVGVTGGYFIDQVGEKQN